MARRPCSNQPSVGRRPAAAGSQVRRERPDPRPRNRAVPARVRDYVVPMFGVVSRSCHDLVCGRIPAWVLFGVMIPAAYVTFGLGVGLSIAGLPRQFDYGRCVISRLCSSRYNPDGYHFLSFGLISLATFLSPMPAWTAHRMGGCPRLCAWGRRTYWAGLLATALIGVERGLCPTHWTRFEVAHFMLATVAFGGLWLGLAMVAGAADVPRVRWRWLWRPPWFLAACVLPILVVFGLCFPFNIMPGTLARALPDWPRRLIFLRTVTFWQWYLVIGLLASSAALPIRARSSGSPGERVSGRGGAMLRSESGFPIRQGVGSRAGMRPGDGVALSDVRRPGDTESDLIVDQTRIPMPNLAFPVSRTQSTEFGWASASRAGRLIGRALLARWADTGHSPRRPAAPGRSTLPP